MAASPVEASGPASFATSSPGPASGVGFPPFDAFELPQAAASATAATIVIGLTQFMKPLPPRRAPYAKVRRRSKSK